MLQLKNDGYSTNRYEKYNVEASQLWRKNPIIKVDYGGGGGQRR